MSAHHQQEFTEVEENDCDLHDRKNVVHMANEEQVGYARELPEFQIAEKDVWVDQREQDDKQQFFASRINE